MKLFSSGMVLPALLALCLLSSGCVGATGDASVSNGTMTASPGTVSFGDVSTGSSASRSVTVANASSASLSLGNVSISGPGFSASGLPSGLTLSPGQSATLTVTFAPASAGAATGQVSIASPASTSPLVVALAGNGTTAAGSRSVLLTWNASTSTVTGYRAYRSTTAGGPYTMLNPTPTPQLRYTDSTAKSGTTYYYVVTAVAPDYVESDYSSQVTAAVPK